MVTGLSFVLYTSAALIAFPELSTLTFWDTECYPSTRPKTCPSFVVYKRAVFPFVSPT